MTTEHSHDKSTAMTMSPDHVDDDKPTEEAMQIYREGIISLRWRQSGMPRRDHQCDALTVPRGLEGDRSPALGSLPQLLPCIMSDTHIINDINGLDDWNT